MKGISPRSAFANQVLCWLPSAWFYKHCDSGPSQTVLHTRGVSDTPGTLSRRGQAVGNLWRQFRG